MNMQQKLRLDPYDDINRIEQSLQIAFRHKRRSEIRHDEVPHEQHPLARQVNEHGTVGFASLHRDQLDPRSSDREFGLTVDRDIWLEAAHSFDFEGLISGISEVSRLGGAFGLVIWNWRSPI